jgi:hypothetical protein
MLIMQHLGSGASLTERKKDVFDWRTLPPEADYFG